jgi:GrpB-like predicted nucleotidyltransferase (UPF0157 family)
MRERRLSHSVSTRTCPRHTDPASRITSRSRQCASLPGSDLWQERLAFRDVLRGDPALRAEYAALKDVLAAEHRADVDAYTEGKRAFVTRVLATVGIAPGRR